MFTFEDDLIAHSKARFADLAAKAGIDARPYSMVQNWIKNDHNRHHIVARFDAKDAPPLILKLILLPQDLDEFEGILKNHRLAQNAVSSISGVTVPELLAFDPDAQVCLMQFLPGETFLDLCRRTDDHAPLLRKAGHWLAAYHRGNFHSSRQFQPKFMARHLMHLVKQMEEGTRKIKGQKRFLELARRAQDFVGPCSGQISKVAAKHGDLNAHNVIISDDETASFDFLPYTTAPVGYDIARFLVSYMQMEGDISQVLPGDVLPPAMLSAFFEGYDLVPPDDPGVMFLLRIQILTDWNRKDHSANATALIRFQRLRALAKRAFG